MSIEAMKQAIDAISQFVEKELTVGQRYTNSGQQLLEEIESLYAAIQQAEAKTNEPVVKNGHMVMVDSGALQMVRNAFQRDARNGMRIRAEMLAALDAATHPAPGVPDDVVRDAERWRVSELISGAALKHPDSRTEAENTAFNAYLASISAGNSYASCIDAAMLAAK